MGESRRYEESRGEKGRVVFLAGPGPESHIVFHALERRFDVVAVIMEKRLSRRKFVERRIRNLGLRRVISQVGFHFLIVPILKWEGKRRLRRLKKAHELNDAPIDEARIVAVDSVNSPEAREHLRRLRPDVVVINGTRIIGEETLGCVEAPFVNTHAGITPNYRGVHGGYWAMQQDEPELFGVTVHLVDRGVDTGKVLAHGLCEPCEKDNFYTYPYLQLATGTKLLCDRVDALLHGEADAREVPTKGTPLWTHPTVGEYVRARVGRGVR